MINRPLASSFFWLACLIHVVIMFTSIASGQILTSVEENDETENPRTESPRTEQPPAEAATPAATEDEKPGKADEARSTTDSRSIRQRAKEIEQRAEQLIKQLGDDDYETRDRAEAELQKIAKLARSALMRATKSSDPEIAGRAKAILSSLPVADHSIVDAIGNPIAFANVKIDITYSESMTMPDDGSGKPNHVSVDKRMHLEMYSDDSGGIAIGDFDRAKVNILVESDTHGFARLEMTIPARSSSIPIPLVARDSEAFKRAAKGQVVNSKGAPVARAQINCSSVRTPGQGLIQANDRLPVVLTDDEGKFAYYLPSTSNERRGKLIPENSNYRLTAAMPFSKSVVPVGAICNNKKETTLKLDTESMLHRFAFETVDGKQPTEQELISQFLIHREGNKDGKSIRAKIDSVAAVKGIRLVPGTYTAYRFDGKSRMNYLPLEVTESSHELLTFKMPPAVTYRGRVINGVTGEPIENAFVIAYSSSGKGSLSMLTDDEWKTLKTVSGEIDTDSDKLKAIRNCYGLDGIIRTKADGTFKLVQPPQRQTYGLIAFDKGMIPFKIRGFYLKDKETGKILQRDYPLFPSAKLLVQPVHEGHRLGVSPRWLIQDEDQPEWIERFRNATEETRGEFEYSDWLPLNEKSAVFLPADLNLRVRFRTPYSEGIAPFTTPKAVKLAAGETHDFGEIRFKHTLPATLRVVDKNGNPVEGVPVRRLHNDERSWSIAHNTDADGRVTIWLNPNSSGKFRAGETWGDGKVEPEFVEFSVKESTPLKVFEIKLSDEKIRKILQR